MWPTVAGDRDQSYGFGGAYSETLMRDGQLMRRSLLKEGYRLIMDFDNEGIELYDVGRDPGEQNNIARTNPSMVTKLRDQLAIWPYRRLAPAFEQAKQGNTSALVEALPRIRNEALLKAAVAAIETHPSPGAESALAKVKKRPDPKQRRR